MHDKIVWSELRPAGDYDVAWLISANYTLQYILAYGFTDPAKKLYLSSDFGASWSEVIPEGSGHSTCSNTCISETGQYMYANNGTHAYKSDDYGASWTEFDPEPSATVSYVHIRTSADGSHVALGAFGTISLDFHALYLSSDYGATWTREVPSVPGYRQTYERGLALSGDGTHVYVTFDEPDLDSYHVRIHKSSNFGSSWSYYERNEDIASYEALACSYDGSIVAAGLNTGFRVRFHVSTDYGVSFFNKNNGLPGTSGGGIVGSIINLACDYSGESIGIACAADVGDSNLYFTNSYGNINYISYPRPLPHHAYDNMIPSSDGLIWIAAGQAASRLWAGVYLVGELDVEWWN
jgi:hypothetical protein